MNGKYTFAIVVALIVAVVFLALFLAQGGTLAVLNPAGIVALQERNLMAVATFLMLLVVVPVFLLTFFIAWRYREGNSKARYAPELGHNKAEEFVWWAVPTVIIVILAAITWTSSHALDPFKPLVSDTKPLTIEVVALEWKWLFIYPEQHIATVNMVEFPENTPINFEITSDAPMNSFWIPRLGGQMYAMPGMVTELHLMASGVGEYTGSSANFSGAGFASMQFAAQSVSQSDFNAWVQSVERSPQALDFETYTLLMKPSRYDPAAYFSAPAQNLFQTIVDNYMSR